MKRSKLALSKAIESGDTDLGKGQGWGGSGHEGGVLRQDGLCGTQHRGGCLASGQQNSLGRAQSLGERGCGSVLRGVGVVGAAWDLQGGKHGAVPCAGVAARPKTLPLPQNAAPAPVYTVVLHLKNELNRGTFFMTLQNQPVALSLYRQVGAARSFPCPSSPAPMPRGGPGGAAVWQGQLPVPPCPPLSLCPPSSASTRSGRR